LLSARSTLREIGWTVPKKQQLPQASLFTLWFYIILLVIGWGKKLYIRLILCLSGVEKTHLFCTSSKMSSYFEFLIIKSPFSRKKNMIFGYSIKNAPDNLYFLRKYLSSKFNLYDTTGKN
jgi:hypothetical protein